MEPKVAIYIVGAVITFIIFALPAGRGASVTVGVSFLISLIWPVAIFVSAQRAIGKATGALRGDAS